MTVKVIYYPSSPTARGFYRGEARKYATPIEDASCLLFANDAQEAFSFEHLLKRLFGK